MFTYCMYAIIRSDYIEGLCMYITVETGDESVGQLTNESVKLFFKEITSSFC